MTDIVDIMDAGSSFGILENLYYFGLEQSFGLMMYVIIPLPFISMWLLSKKVVLPATLYTVIGGPVMILAPWELKGPFMLMFIFGVSGLIYQWFKDR